MPPEDSYIAEDNSNENVVAPIINEVSPESTETDLAINADNQLDGAANASAGDFKRGNPVKLAPFDPPADLDPPATDKGQASLESDLAKLKAEAEKENAAKLNAANAEAAKIIENAKLEAARIRAAEAEAAKAELAKIEAAKKETARIEAAKAEAAKAEALRLLAIKAAEDKAQAEADAAAEAAKVAKETKVEKKVETNLLLKKIREEAEAKRRKAEEVAPEAPDSPSAFNQPPSSPNVFGERNQVASNAEPSSHSGRIVLKANQVDRKVVFQPLATPPRSAVPALAASFKRGQITTNTLRGPQHSLQQPAAATATIIAQANPVEEQPQQFAPRVDTNRFATQQVPVRTVLRAVPMSEGAIRGRHVQVRFKNHQPAQHANGMNLEKFPLNHVPAPGHRIETLEPRINVEIAEPIQDNSWFDRTARNEQPSDDAIPPWRK